MSTLRDHSNAALARARILHPYIKAFQDSYFVERAQREGKRGDLQYSQHPMTHNTIPGLDAMAFPDRENLAGQTTTLYYWDEATETRKAYPEASLYEWLDAAGRGGAIARLLEVAFAIDVTYPPASWFVRWQFDFKGTLYEGVTDKDWDSVAGTITFRVVVVV